MNSLNEYILLPLLPIVVFTVGIYFFARLGFYDPAVLFSVLKLPFKAQRTDGISPLSALAVSLAGTLGVGNIAGVATAISLGGAGAVLWMWVSAVICMSIKYVETYLAVKYREGHDGHYVGGPMYYMEKCFGTPVFSTVFGVLCLCSCLIASPTVQVGCASGAVRDMCGVPRVVTGAVFAVLCYLTVRCGISSISSFCEKLIPLVTGVFFLVSLAVVISSYKRVPNMLGEIFSQALDIKSAFAGFGGHMLGKSIKQGTVKGILSHEAGCGVASIAHAASDASSPSHQGACGMLEVLVDTVIMCTLTAFVILLSGVDVSGYDGVKTTGEAYSVFFPTLGGRFITSLTVFYAFAAIICQAYHVTVCMNYLTKNETVRKVTLPLFCLCVILGSCVAPSFMWELSDTFTCILTLFNTVCLALLAKHVNCRGNALFCKIL